MLLSPAAHASVVNGKPGEFFYRYKTFTPVAVTPNAPQTKDITAFYIGGVGHEFSEQLPMKAEWEDDDWRLVSGSLPDGINFNPVTKTFSGIPTTDAKGTVVSLEGFDGSGNSVATASVTFDIYTVQGTPITVDLYAHTGKYKADTLAIPSGITVDSWRRVYMPPNGITVNGPYFEGIPTQANVYPVFIQGLNYMGDVVATFFGKYTVEDGPTFAHIPDNVKPLPKLESGTWGLGFSFGAPTPYKAQRLINPSRQASYFLELDTGEELPVGVVSNALSKNLNLYGYVRQPYDTAKVRFKALDSDETVGYSNWFTFGSSDPQPDCNPYHSGDPLTTRTGISSKIAIPKPWGKQGVVTYHLETGSFPDGLSLDSASGLIEGTPVVAGQKTDINIRIDVTNDNNVVSTNCAYKMEVVAGNVRLADVTPDQQKHIRAGDVYSGRLRVVGGITPYSVVFDKSSDWPTLAITSATQNNPEVTVSGPINDPGNKSVAFKLENGDTASKLGNLTIHSHGPLDTGSVPKITVKRLAKSTTWGLIPYDDATVIPEVAAPGKYPQFTLNTQASQNGVPNGISILSGGFVGATSADEGIYGPLTVTMSDFSGQTKLSNTFNIVVEPRDEIAIERTVPTAFVVETPTGKRIQTVIVKQPDGAEAFKLDWRLNDITGNGLPSWLSFDKDSGEFVASENIPLIAIGEYGPFSITATDSEGSTVTSADFFVKAIDWPQPETLSVGLIKSNVSGDILIGETQTHLDIPNLKRFILPDTVIGGLAAVTFVSAEPQTPAGLNFDASNGAFTGIPTSEFDGIVKVTFIDGKGREGKINIPLKVIPYPSVGMEAQQFELPRLSAPSDATPPLIAKTIAGFWNAANFDWDPTSTPLPQGITATNTGALDGSTALPADTVIKSMRLRATTVGADGTRLVTYTPHFDIKIVDPKQLSLSYSPAKATFRFTETNNGLTLVSKTPPVAVPSGSYVKPLAYSIDQSEARADGMTGTIDINPNNGDIIGQPDKLGTWTVFISLKDAEQRTISESIPVEIFSTLSGYVIAGDGKDGYAGGGEFTLRQGEPFSTPPITLSQVVGTPIFSINPAAPRAAPVFDALTGAFTDDSAFSEPVGSYDIRVDVKDADGRTFDFNKRPQYTFHVIKPLEMSIDRSSQSISSRQYSANEGEMIDIAFSPTLTNQIGNITYDIEGELPGTLVHRIYDDAGPLPYFAYSDAKGIRHTTTELAALPLDALVLDTKAATLKGIPSKLGTFTGIKLVASDDHQNGYIKSTPTKVKNNTATSEDITITVAAPNQLLVANMVGSAEASDDIAYQFTTTPSIRSVVTNAAYGQAVTWTQIAGKLPRNIEPLKGSTLSYSGYPEETGTFGGIVWRATDAAGRSVDTISATITVTPRKELELVADTPVNLIVDTTIVNVAVTPRFPGYGKPIGTQNWTVSGVANLPPGITHSIENNQVEFSGVATVIGTYKDIVVSAVDSLGSRASLSLTFEVTLPTDAIVLNVENIRTKANIPFEMQSTSSNTYGHVRYFSHDITGVLADQLTLDGNSGLVSGAFTSAQNLDFDVYVTDESSRVTTKPVVVEVIPNLRLTVPQEVQFNPVIAQSRGTATDYILGKVSYQIVNSDNWPTGMSVDPSTGVINSDGTTPVGEYPDLAIEAFDTFASVGQTFVDKTTSNTFTIKVDTYGPHIALTGGNLDPWFKRKPAYELDMKSVELGFIDYRSIGIAEVVWTLPTQLSGKRFPPGLSLSANGVITGTPVESGDFEFDVKGTYKADNKVTSTATYRMHIGLLPLTLELADGTLPDAESGKPYSFDFKQLLTFDNIPENVIGWTKTNVDPLNPLPAGLSLTRNVLAGTPTGADDYEFRVKVTYANTNLAVEKIESEKTFKLYVKKAAPYFIGSIANLSRPIKQQVSIKPNFGNKHKDDVYSLVGTYPTGLFYTGGPISPGDTAPGLTFNTQTGEISGATRFSGEFQAQIKVTDKLSQEAISNVFTLKILDNMPTFVGTFDELNGLEPGIQVLSNPVLVSGNTTLTPTTFTSPTGLYGYGRLCDSAAAAISKTCSTSTPSFNGTIVRSIPSGSYVIALLTAPPTFDTEATATLDFGGVTRTFTIKTRPSNTDPINLGTFSPATDVEPGQSVGSAILKVDGITDDAPVSLELLDGDGSAVAFKCNAIYGTSGNCITSGRFLDTIPVNVAARKIANGEYIQLRVDTKKSFATTTRVMLKVGTVERIFSVTTRDTDTSPKNLGEFVPAINVEKSSFVTSNILEISGVSDPTPIKVEVLEGATGITVLKCTAGFGTSGNCSAAGRYSDSIAAGQTGKTVQNGDYIQLRASTANAYGAIARYKVTVGDVERIWTVTNTPDGQLSATTNFIDLVDAEPGKLAVSNVIRIEGLATASPATISLVAGTGTSVAYICSNASNAQQGNCTVNGTFKTRITTTAAQTILNGEFLHIAHTTESKFDTTATVKITINGESRYWTVITRKDDATPKTVDQFEDKIGVEASGTTLSNVVKATGYKDAAHLTFERIEGTFNANLRICNVASAQSNNCYLTSGHFRTTVNLGGTANVMAGEGLVVSVSPSAPYGSSSKFRVTLGGIVREFRVTVRPSVTNPDNLAEFGTITDAEPSATIASPVIKVSGITDATKMTAEIVEGSASQSSVLMFVCAAKYASSGDCFSSDYRYTSRTPSTLTVNVAPNSSIQLRVPSGSALEATTKIKVTIGDVERFFTIKTRGTDSTPENLDNFVDVFDAQPGTTLESNALQVNDITEAALVTSTSTGVTNDGNAFFFTCATSAVSAGSCYSWNSAKRAPEGSNSLTVKHGEFVGLRTRASFTPGGVVTMTVTVGGVTRTWKVTTAH
jgi:hypothetical protein